jgi:hypothetical protein
LRSSVDYEDEFYLDDSRITGYGIIEYDAQAGEEYEYILKKDGTIIVRESFYDDDTEKSGWREIESCNVLNTVD